MNEKCIFCKERKNLPPNVSYGEMICHYHLASIKSKRIKLKIKLNHSIPILNP